MKKQTDAATHPTTTARTKEPGRGLSDPFFTTCLHSDGRRILAATFFEAFAASTCAAIIPAAIIPADTFADTSTASTFADTSGNR